MGLFRCPKCDAICHTDEEVCHLCGYRLKPTTETKAEVKPQEEKKEETIVSQKNTIGSGFSRKSLFNSVSFDKNEEPKEDIFETYGKQTLDNKVVETEEKLEEAKPIFATPVVEPKVEPKVETKIEPLKVEETKVEVKPVVEQPKVEQPKIEVKPAVEAKPKPTTSNPYTNTGYKPNPSVAPATSAITTAKPRKEEPAWVTEWKEKIKKNKKTAAIWTCVLFFLFIFFLILVSNDKTRVYHEFPSFYSGNNGYYTEEAKGGWIFLSVLSGIGLIVSIVYTIVFATATLFVKEIEGSYVLVYNTASDYRLIIGNRIVDRHYSGRYSSGSTAIKLSGKLPNGKTVLATIFYKNYNKVCKVEIVESL